MADSIRDLFFGTPSRELVEAIEPRRSFDDVVLPQPTLRALNHALALVRKHDLIFHQWGLAERHSSGLGLAFHFAGPPGTGKTICAEALAYALDKRLLVVRYAELESRWVGQTAKHVASVFRSAARQDAVLFFDEADAIAGRRFTSMNAAYEREANAMVNVLLHELEHSPAWSSSPPISPPTSTRPSSGGSAPTSSSRCPTSRSGSGSGGCRSTPGRLRWPTTSTSPRWRRLPPERRRHQERRAEGGPDRHAEPVPDPKKRIHQRHFIQGMEEVIAAEASCRSRCSRRQRRRGSPGGVLEQMAEGAGAAPAPSWGWWAERLEGRSTHARVGLSQALRGVCSSAPRPLGAPRSGVSSRRGRTGRRDRGAGLRSDALGRQTVRNRSSASAGFTSSLRTFFSHHQHQEPRLVALGP